MPMSEQDLRAYLTEAFPDAEIEIEDLAGDGDHYRARIVSTAFAGLSRVARHRLVYDAVADWMPHRVHALAVTAITPAEAGDT